jgi:predicted DCC family thiol-disulfide oxidoreductase YuxK
MISLAMAEAIVSGGQWGTAPLTVLYDPGCPLCARLKSWLAGQSTTVPVEFVAAGSAQAHRRFPDLDHERTVRVLTVVGRGGEVYEGERAWLVCAWSLPSWQPVAEHFDGPLRRRIVGLVAGRVDAYRHRRMAATYGESCERCPSAAGRPVATSARCGS